MEIYLWMEAVTGFMIYLKVTYRYLFGDTEEHHAGKPHDILFRFKIRIRGLQNTMQTCRSVHSNIKWASSEWM
jgi:hypothetical protein